MAFEGLICPACSNSLDEKNMLEGNLVCTFCKTNLKQKKYLAFLNLTKVHGSDPIK